jgi:hypothetical protein
VPKGSLEISTYQAQMASDAPVLDDAQSPSVRALECVTDRVPAAALGASVSLLLHALLVTSVLWSTGARHAHPPDRRLSGSARIQSDEGAAMQWIVLDMGPGPSADIHPSIAAALIPVTPVSLQADLADVAAELDADLAEDMSGGSSSTAADSASDGAALVAMAGRYIGQINARIDRAWMRPRTAIGAPTFSCRVRIDQDRAGIVLDITLERCNGDARWQLSLVQAIESASPLPAPPDPAVFAPVVHMSFRAAAYRPGSPEGDYEPKAFAQAAQATAPDDSAQLALDRLRDALQKPHPNQVINLTITGSVDGTPLKGPPLGNSRR